MTSERGSSILWRLLIVVLRLVLIIGVSITGLVAMMYLVLADMS